MTIFTIFLKVQVEYTSLYFKFHFVVVEGDMILHWYSVKHNWIDEAFRLKKIVMGL